MYMLLFKVAFSLPNQAFVSVANKPDWEFPINNKIIPMLTCSIDDDTSCFLNHQNLEQI